MVGYCFPLRGRRVPPLGSGVCIENCVKWSETEEENQLAGCSPGPGTNTRVTALHWQVQSRGGQSNSSGEIYSVKKKNDFKVSFSW